MAFPTFAQNSASSNSFRELFFGGNGGKLRTNDVRRREEALLDLNVLMGSVVYDAVATSGSEPKAARSPTPDGLGCHQRRRGTACTCCGGGSVARQPLHGQELPGFATGCNLLGNPNELTGTPCEPTRGPQGVTAPCEKRS